LALLAVVALALAAYAGIPHGSGPASPGQGNGPETYTVGLFGDMPYNAQGKADYPYLLHGINKGSVAFSIFDGDLKAGGDGPCSNSLYTNAIAGFNSLSVP
jgi:hypothetical protein